MRLNKEKVESKVNRIVKDYVRNRIDIVDVLEYYFHNDSERLDKIIKRFNDETFDKRRGMLDGGLPLTMEDIKDFRYYLNEVNHSVDKKAQIRSLDIQRRLLDIIAEDAMSHDLEEILTEYDDTTSIQYMLYNDILCGARFVESDLLYGRSFGNRYAPYYIKYTWEEYKEMYFPNMAEADEYAYKLMTSDRAVYIGDNNYNRNTVCTLVTLAFATAIAIMYERHNMEDEGITKKEYLASCINSDIIVDVLNDLCISSSVSDILYFMVDTIDEIFDSLYIRRSKEYLLEYIEIRCEGEIDIKRVENYINEVYKELA